MSPEVERCKQVQPAADLRTQDRQQTSHGRVRVPLMAEASALKINQEF